MSKKTIIIILVAVVAVGGAYYGIHRWRQTGGLLGVLTGGGGKLANLIGQETAKEAAEEEAQQKADEAEEAAKTPEDRYNETKEAAAYDANSKAAVSEIKEIVEKVFGKAKLTSVYTDIYDSAGSSSRMMEFKIARLITGDDLSAFNKALTDNGLSITQSIMSDKTAIVVASGNETVTYSFGFEVDGQIVSANIVKNNQ